MTVHVLNSWKEVASYMNRGVRTVQRWERDLNLPVRRPRGKSRSAVIALADDLDAWLKRTPLPDATPKKRPASVVDIVASRERLHRATLTLHSQSVKLYTNIQRAQELCEQLNVKRRMRDSARSQQSNAIAAGK